jgi:hypothetical protein
VYVDYMVKDRLHAFARPIGPLGILPKKQTLYRDVQPHITSRAPSSTLIKKKSTGIDTHNYFEHGI